MTSSARRACFAIASLALVAGCAEGNAPRELEKVEAFGEPPLSYIEFEGGKDGEPPPPPKDTLSRADGAPMESASLMSAESGATQSLASSSVSFSILHRATFTSDLEGTMGWIAWGRAPQPKGTYIEGEAEVYYRADSPLSGKGVVRIIDGKGSVTIDFARHLDTKNATINTACKAEKGGACATLYYRGATYRPRDSKVGTLVSGRLLVGVAQ